jgi:hypothetical protein
MTLDQLLEKKANREKQIHTQRLILQSFTTMSDITGDDLLSVVTVIIKLESELKVINETIRATRGGNEQ